LFSGPAELLDYRDNARGGIETDCLLRLQFAHQGRPVAGRVELSRTRTLRNTLRVECERGTLEVRPDDRHHVWILPRAARADDPRQGGGGPYRLRAGFDNEPELPWYEPFRVQFDDWLTAIRTGDPPQLSGASVLPTVQLIEECYRSARPLDEP